MRVEAFEKAGPLINDFLDKNPRKAYTEKALEIVFHQYRNLWRIPESKTSTNFIAYLKRKSLKVWNFYSSADNKEVNIYSWKTSDELTIISGLKTKAYFTHYTAIYLHGLSEQIPRNYYLNSEHSGQMINRDSHLEQETIDKVFSKEQRKAGESFKFGTIKITLLNGQFTNRLGVIDKHEVDKSYSYTDLPRTLIDIAIRPAYAGGVFEVLKAYKNAKDQLNVTQLKNYLDQLNLIYPYHQVIGYYLDKTSYPESALSLFDNKSTFKFYLTYAMKNPQYDERWKLYYPKGIEIINT